MSSEMREIKAMADAVEYGIALGKLDAPAVFTKMRDLLNLALLARTEAAPVADGAVAYQHREAGTEKWYDCSKEYYDTLQKHPWDRATMRRQELRALYTRPHDASGDAVTGRVNGYMFSARAIEIITDCEVPEWITKTPGLRVTITAMQAKEAK